MTENERMAVRRHRTLGGTSVSKTMIGNSRRGTNRRMADGKFINKISWFVNTVLEYLQCAIKISKLKDGRITGCCVTPGSSCVLYLPSSVTVEWYMSQERTFYWLHAVMHAVYNCTLQLNSFMHAYTAVHASDISVARQLFGECAGTGTI